MEKAAIFLTIATVKFVLTLVEFAILVVSFFYAWFSVLIVGFGLILARKTLLGSIPFLIDLAVPITLFVDSVIISHDMLEAFCTTVHNAIGSLIGETDVSFTPISPISVDAFSAEMKMISKECTPIDSVSAIAIQWLPELVDETLCPVFRAMWPIPYNLSRTVYAPFSGWVSDPTPYPHGGNCVRNSTNSHGIFCAALAIGYPVIEVILPSLFGGLLLVSSGTQIFGILWWVMLFVVAVLDECACILLNLIRSLRTALVEMIALIEYTL
jgi:hypothetical protein